MKMIDLMTLSEDARGVLVKAIPHQAGGFSSEDKEYFKLYEEFMRATNWKYNGEGSFEKFQCAVVGMKRKLKTLTYKNSLEEIMLKGRVQCDF